MLRSPLSICRPIPLPVEVVLPLFECPRLRPLFEVPFGSPFGKVCRLLLLRLCNWSES